MIISCVDLNQKLGSSCWPVTRLAILQPFTAETKLLIERRLLVFCSSADSPPPCYEVGIVNQARNISY